MNDTVSNSGNKEDHTLESLIAIMARLRDPDSGCPWDLEQDFKTIAPYTIEEAYEVLDAIERNDRQGLQDELGDLLFQVVFHAQMAGEKGWFEFADVVDGICRKMLRRHPHVFAGERIDTAREQNEAWEKHKTQERGHADSVLDGVALALPALMRAEKLGRRAARSGFDWPDVSGVIEKVREELEELTVELASNQNHAAIKEEVGDLLLAVVSLARQVNVDAEDALRQANEKFTRRFHFVEQCCSTAGKEVSDAGLETLESFWQQAKQVEKGA